jgi:hypothetical protein
MKVQSKTLLAVVCAALVTTAAYAQAPAAGAAPARRLVPALHGEAEIVMTDPVLKNDGKNFVTTFKVKNLSKQPVAGFKIEEFWYDAKGGVVGGDTFRYPKPLQPDEIIEIKFTDVRTGKESNNNYKFSHSNGTVKKPTRVKKLP